MSFLINKIMNITYKFKKIFFRLKKVINKPSQILIKRVRIHNLIMMVKAYKQKMKIQYQSKNGQK